MKRETEYQSMTKNPENLKKLAILFAVLFILALAGAIYLFFANDGLQSEAQIQKKEIESLGSERSNLQSELALIENDFSTKITENEDLSAQLESNLKEVEALQWRVKDAKKKLNLSKEENEDIKLRLVQLEALKSDLEDDIAALASTNVQLKLTNTEIKSQLESANEYTSELNDELVQVSERNAKLINRLYTVAPAGFIADNFIVTAKKRNNKLTASARNTDRVNVSFDLNDVPGEYQADEKIYLVFTTFDGQPVATIATQKVKISAREPFDIEAADVENLRLNERQNLEMSVAADKDLESGTYNLLIYADHGFLGATSFQLR